MTLDEILKEIKKVQNICIMAHEGPDGDAIGSSLGLFHIFSGMGKNVEKCQRLLHFCLDLK